MCQIVLGFLFLFISCSGYTLDEVKTFEKALKCFENLNQTLEDACQIKENLKANKQMPLQIMCFKQQYLNNGCNMKQWKNVCNRFVTVRYDDVHDLRHYELIHPARYACNENDKAFECLLTASHNTTDDECPDVNFFLNGTQEIWLNKNQNDFDIEEYTRLSVSCLKKYYLNNSCEEQEWTRVCLKGMDSFDIKIIGKDMLTNIGEKYCINGKDTDYECLENATKEMSKDSCPELIYSENQHSETHEVARQQISCYKRHYLNHDCNIGEWQRVCNKKVDNNSMILFDSEAFMFYKKYCNVLTFNLDPFYYCYKKAIKQMKKDACPELNHAIDNNAHIKYVIDGHAACHKRMYINHGCDLTEWNRICHAMIKTEEFENYGMHIEYGREFCDY